MKRDTLIGKKFHQLTVVGQLKSKNQRRIWKCLCSCGVSVNIATEQLSSGGRKTCGCSKRRSGSDHPNWSGCGEVTGHLVARIRLDAIKRGIGFSIDSTMLWDMLVAQNHKCALSGAVIFLKKGKGTASLDRINSDRGYVVGNIQWVHADINRMKTDLPEHVFIEWCKLIAENYERTESECAQT